MTHPFRMVFRRWLPIQLGLVGAIVGLSGLARAEIYGQKVGFGEAPLDSRCWQLVSGKDSDVKITNRELQLTATTGQPAGLIYRFYPLRFEGAREAFGDFKAVLTLNRPGQGQTFAFGLRVGEGWRLELELNSERTAARLVLTTRPEGGGEATVSAGEWVPVELPADQAFQLELIRCGTWIEAGVGREQKRVLVGKWHGQPAPLPELILTARPGKAAAAPAIRELALAPLPRLSVDARLLPREGRPLPGDEGLPEAYRQIGGAHEGGYLWGRGEKAEIRLHLSNVKTETNSVIMRTERYNWQDERLAEEQQKLELAAAQEQDLSLPLPSDRCGYFRLVVRLESPAGEPLLAPLSVGYGITAAPAAAELADDNPVGTHGLPFGREGAKWVRYWDNGGKGMHWSGIEPQRGEWNWAELDAYVERTLAAGMRPLVVLSCTPEWASSDTSYGNYRGRGSFSPAKDLADWAEYCRRVAERYRGKVGHYEIWNEPNNSGLQPRGYFFYAPPEKYLELLKAAYPAIKAADPAAQVLAPSGTGHFFPFLERIIELGGGDYFDILSIHTYCIPFPPEIGYQFNGEKSYLHRVSRSREILARFGKLKPIWNTEIGYHGGLEAAWAGVPITQDQIASEALPGNWPNWSKGWSFRPLDPRRTACFMSRFILLSLAYGVEHCFIHHRLVSRDTGSPYLPAPAVGWLGRWLNGARYDRPYLWAEAVQAHGYQLSGGRYGLAFWRVEEESLMMNARDDRKLGEVDSAPVTDAIAAQRAIDIVTGRPPRTTYFPDERIAPQTLRLSPPPDEAYDLWGNPLPITPEWTLAEAPAYLVWKAAPAGLLGGVVAGKISAVADPELKIDAGELSREPAAPLAYPQVLTDLLPTAKKLALHGGTVTVTGGEIHPGTVYVNENGRAELTVPAEFPTVGRLVLGVRAGDRAGPNFNYTYGLEAAGQESELAPWSVWPLEELGRGKGWAEMKGYVISPPLALKAGDKFAILGRKANGRIYEVWLMP